MSTTYHELSPPITSVRCLHGVIHTHVTLWINGANAGALLLRNEEEVSAFLLSISKHGTDIQGDGDDAVCCAVCVDNGMVRVNQRHIEEDQSLISANGELTDLRSLLVTYKQEPNPNVGKH